MLGSPFLANQNWASLSDVTGRALCSLIGLENWKTNKKLWIVVKDYNLNDLEFFLNFVKLRQLISFILDSSILLICVFNERIIFFDTIKYFARFKLRSVLSKGTIDLNILNQPPLQNELYM